MGSHQSSRISDDQAAVITAALVEALRASTFDPFRFIGGKERYNHTQIRQLHTYALEGRYNLKLYEFYLIKVQTEASRLAHLVNALETPISHYLDKVSRQLGFGQRELTLDEFAKATIRAAAIASPEEAVSAIQGWVAGEPWIRTHTFTLTGITVPSPLNIGVGVSLKQLPKHEHELRLHAPSMLVDELQRPGIIRSSADIRGATVLCWEDYQRPVFWAASQPPEHVEQSAFPGDIACVFSLLRALSLVCNANVENQYQWINCIPLLRAFGADSGEGYGGSPRQNYPSVTPQVTLTQPLLEHALRVSMMLQNAPDPVSEVVKRVFSRWTDSLCGLQPYDQLIDMRIALESLFAGQGRNEATLRVAYHGARYLGESPETRRCLFDDIKAIYSTASTLIHGGTPKPSRNIRQLVQRAQCICRDAMLKMLKESKIPDWTDLMLNGP